VSKAVGGSVVRNQVKRRLRHLLRARVAALPTGAVLAVRALPASASMRSAELGGDLDRCLSRVGVTVSSVPQPTTETAVR
jgi:ribonuclease P protein component